MRIPEPGPFGETFGDASVRAMVLARLLNSPAGGCVESVLTLATQRLFGLRSAMANLHSGNISVDALVLSLLVRTNLRVCCDTGQYLNACTSFRSQAGLPYSVGIWAEEMMTVGVSRQT